MSAMKCLSFVYTNKPLSISLNRIHTEFQDVWVCPQMSLNTSRSAREVTKMGLAVFPKTSFKMKVQIYCSFDSHFLLFSFSQTDEFTRIWCTSQEVSSFLYTPSYPKQLVSFQNLKYVEFQSCLQQWKDYKEIKIKFQTIWGNLTFTIEPLTHLYFFISQ